jgi:regulatory protein
MDNKIFLKACSYCAYQERTHQEVRERLSEWHVWGDESEEIISKLIEENFLNEERFAKAFAGGKFRVKKWGRRKILFELKARKLSPYCIKVAMQEISDEDYWETLQELASKKLNDLRTERSVPVKNQKIARYLMGKGYESDLIWEAINSITLN